MSIYDTLNPKQRKAVEHERGPLLILAGAGSGKTRVLTHRIAYLIEECNVSPYRIMAITFTNKAAKEMRERVDKIVGYGAENIWVSTFHSSCVRMLRRFIENIGYGRNFTIYDTDDQKTLMREVCKYLNIDTKQTKERAFLSVISSAKNELISPEEYELRAAGDFGKQNYAKVYKEYQKRLKTSNALDFDDLILKTVELFQTNQEALSYYQNRFQFIMVDEYQDTNTAQFQLISLLASTVNEFGETEHNLCVVGDDDQSIYKFRGANIRNILDFEKKYPDTKVIKLEQNYRSTKNILNAANEVITNNLGRKDKSLWTDNPEGEPVSFIQYETDYEEAAFIVSDIYEKKQSLNLNYSDFAILYRTNAQSRVFEEKLIMKSVPYKIIGSINFYQRKEIKDLLCYLKTIDNGLSELSVKRIINVPKRGIGLASIEKVESYAQKHNMNFYNALCHSEQVDGLGRSASKITSFISFIESMKSNLSKNGYSLKRLMEEIIENTGYMTELETSAESEDEINDRRGNIDELINKIASYEETCDDIPTLSGFLEEVALVADTDNLENEGNAVVLMTLHSAKGLEFPYVYLCGMEEGIFPSYMSINAEDPELEIEEERRLCYVGITRAMKQLFLSAAKLRMLRGETQYNRVSRFIGEIPRYLLNYKNAATRTHLAPEGSYGFSAVRMAGMQPVSQTTNGMKTMRGGTVPNFEKPASNSFSQKPAYSTASAKPYTLPPKQFGSPNLTSLDYGVGDLVSHIKFGTGTVTDIVKGGRDYEVTVDFGTAGIKKMLSSFAKLTKTV